MISKIKYLLGSSSIAMSGAAVGYISQLSWISKYCANGKASGPCSHNDLRLFLGPVAISIGLLALIFTLHWALRRKSTSYIKNWQGLCFGVLPLNLVWAVPIIGGHLELIVFVAFISASFMIFLIRKELLAVLEEKLPANKPWSILKYTWLANFIESNSYAKYLIATGSIVLLVGIDRLVFAHFWAEDGALFFAEAFHLGVDSVGKPYSGYYHLVPRLVAFSLTKIPLVLVPFVIASFCYLVFALVAIEFLRKDYERLIASIWLRAVFCVCFLLTPGVREVVGNLANIHSLCFWYLCLVSIRMQRSARFYELPLVALAAFSAGETIVLVPLFGMRLMMAQRNKAIKVFFFNLISLLFILAAASSNYLAKESGVGIDIDLVSMVKVFAVSMSKFLLARPFLGSNLTNMLDLLSPTIWITTTAITAILFTRYWLKRSSLEDSYILLLSFCTLGVLVLISIVRPGMVGRLLGSAEPAERYGFQLMPMAPLMWLYFLNKLPNSIKGTNLNIRHFALILFICIQLGSNLNSIPYKAYGREFSWMQDYKHIEDSRATVRIPIYPKGWHMKLVKKNNGTLR